MSVKVITIFLVLFFVSCSSIQYNTPDTSFSYTRFLNQEIKGLHLKKDMDGVEASLDSQKSKTEIEAQITEILKILRKVAERLL